MPRILVSAALAANVAAPTARAQTTSGRVTAKGPPPANAHFEAEAKRDQAPEIKALDAKAPPKIKEHLNMLKPIVKKYEDEHQDQDGIQPRE